MLLAVVVFGSIFCFAGDLFAAESYQNMEAIPGQESPTDSLSVYLQQLYKFGISVAALLAVVMVALGGFMYMVGSAGNVGKMIDGKDMIISALTGLGLVMLIYLIVFTINPDLLTGNLTGSTTGVDQGVRQGGYTYGTAAPSGCNEEMLTEMNNAAATVGINAEWMAAMLRCGEGCNAKKSPAGACGYGQVIDGPYGSCTKCTYNRSKICGLSGTPEQTCQKVIEDRRADMICSAKVIKDAANKSGCGNSLGTLARCYNGGNINAYNKETNNYVQKVTNCSK